MEEDLDNTEQDLRNEVNFLFDNLPVTSRIIVLQNMIKDMNDEYFVNMIQNAICDDEPAEDIEICE